MSDWVHCNACFLLPGGGSSVNFHLTNCGHIFCDNCLKQDKSGKCKLCGQPYSTIFLTNKMKPEIEQFFLKSVELIKKDLKRAIQVIDFQDGHRQRLFSHLMRERKKSSSSAEGLDNSKVNELLKENQRLREENEQLKKMVQYFREGQNPGMTQRRPTTPGSQAVPSSPVNTARGTPMCPNSRGIPSSPAHGMQQGTPGLRSTSTVSLQQRVAAQMKTPTGPDRLSIRTPPSNGMIGAISFWTKSAFTFPCTRAISEAMRELYMMFENRL